MPNVRVTCPTCATPLELEAEYVGQEVQCGNCHQVFVAREDRRSRHDDEDDDRPSRRRRSRRDEDDYDFDDRPRRRRASSGSSSLGTWALVLGILSIPMACCCGLFSTPLAMGGLICGVMGMRYPESRGSALAGAICGGIGLALMIASLALGLAMNFGQLGNKFNRRQWGPQPQQQQWPPPPPPPLRQFRG